MGRSPCCSKDEGLNRGAWTAMEDKVLTEYIRNHGEGKWRNLPKRAGEIHHTYICVCVTHEPFLTRGLVPL